MRKMIWAVVALAGAAPVGALEPKDVAHAAIQVAKIRVKEQLRDPGSATFRSVTALETPKGGVIVCGEVNSKNGFGGFTGHKKFVRSSDTLVMEESFDAAEFVTLWNGTCAAWKVLLTEK